MTLFPINLTSTIGKGYPSEETDIRQARQLFNHIGYDAGDESFGYNDQTLEKAIRQFQRDNDLKEDSIMHPNGETANALRLSIAPKPAHKPKKPPIPPRKQPYFEPKNGHAMPFFPEDLLTAKGIGKAAGKYFGRGNKLKEIISDNLITRSVKEGLDELRDTENNPKEKAR
jgi:peptidoglycan hydrolase-like protein with peptidoglycan-binding domain